MPPQIHKATGWPTLAAVPQTAVLPEFVMEFVKQGWKVKASDVFAVTDPPRVPALPVTLMMPALSVVTLFTYLVAPDEPVAISQFHAFAAGSDTPVW